MKFVLGWKRMREFQEIFKTKTEGYGKEIRRDEFMNNNNKKRVVGLGQAYRRLKGNRRDDKR